ncbi:MAG: sodium-dependent transporter [Alphaproteobacteria bacterium]|jgi:NSS family neurotransmitter:Na+ symporter|nr:sodium-dependent transporter [Alphaproteobacteria bacterium]
MSKKENESGFKTNLGAVLSAIGSAAGLGNIWRFPFKMGTEGGSLFLLGYIFVSLLICLPLLISEFVIGRAGGGSNLQIFDRLKPKSLWWLVGLLGILTTTLIICFYNLIGGWIVYYFVESITLNLTQNNDYSAYFGNFMSDPFIPLIFLFIFTVVSALVVARGIQKGIEKINVILMPIFALVLVGLMIYSFTLPNTSQAMRFLFVPDFSLFNRTTFISIIAQAFFSLSLGMGIMMLYGGYMSKKDNLVKNALQTTIFSAIIFSLVSSILIFNIVFAYNLDMSAGPKLLFIVLPQAFSSMFLGEFVAPVFFILIFVAAFTSAISLLEVPTVFLHKHFNLSRGKAVAIISILIMIIGSLASLSLSGYIGVYGRTLTSFIVLLVIMVVGCILLYKPALKYFKNNHELSERKSKQMTYLSLLGLCVVIYGFFDFNIGKGIFDILDTTTEQITIPLGGILVAIFISMVMDKKAVKHELNIHGESRWYNSFMFFNKYLIPISILTIMAYTFF